MSVLVGPDEGHQLGGPFDVVVRVRAEQTNMWNSEATPARIIEVLTPGGSEQWFEEIAALQPDDQDGFQASCQRHGIEFFPDSPWQQELQARYGL
jgi:hypothetical protein